MFRQSPSRNQRSKRFKVKHGAQIFLLFAICMWLLYQVKHSHDKKKAFDESTAELSGKIENEHEMIKFGRKDLHPRVEETATENETHVLEEEGEEEIKHEEEEEEENKREEEEEDSKHEEEEEDNKHEDEEESKNEEDAEENKHDEEEDEIKHEEEEEQSKHDEEEDEIKHEEEEEQSKHDEEGEETKPEVIVNEKRGGGDDEIDEQDLEASDEDAKRGEDFVDEEEKDREEKDSLVEDVGVSEDQDHDRSTQEAREENYTGDDASSAVQKDTQVSTAEGGSRKTENSNDGETVKTTEMEMDIKTNMKNVTTGENDQNQNSEASETTDGDNHSVNVTVSDADGSETNSSKKEFEAKPVESNRTEITHSSGSFLENRTGLSTGVAQEQILETVPSAGRSDSGLEYVVHNQTENSNTLMGAEQSDSSSTLATTTGSKNVATGESVNSSNNSEAVVNGESDNISVSSTTNEKEDGAQDQKLDATDRTVEADGHTISSVENENADTVPIDSIDNSISEEEKEARTDLETLPTTETEGSNTEDSAAE